MRVIVCGGRKYHDQALAFVYLDVAHKVKPFSCLAQGGAHGADQIARLWTYERGIPLVTYHAMWDSHGKGAGPRRNAFMLEDFRPDLVIAFPGGAGTKNMVELARKAGVEVEEVTE